MWLRSKKELNAEQRNGSMILYPAKRKMGQVSGFMGVRPMDFACEVGMTFSFDPKTVGEEVGLMIYLSSEFHYRIGKQKRSDGVYLIMERTAEDLVQPVMERRIGPGKALHATFRRGKRRIPSGFGKRGTTGKWSGRVSNPFISCEVSGRCFTGTLIGIYAWSAEDTDSKVIGILKFYQKTVEKRDGAERREREAAQIRQKRRSQLIFFMVPFREAGRIHPG